MTEAAEAAGPSDTKRTGGTDKVPAYSWYALSVLVLVYVLNFIDRQILSILANDIKADLGVEDDYLGFLYGTAFAVFYALFGIPLGKLADSWKRIRLMTIGNTGGWRNFAIVILVVLCAAAFFLGRLEGKTEVRWQRGDGKKGADGVTKSPARLVRVEKKTR